MEGGTVVLLPKDLVAIKVTFDPPEQQFISFDMASATVSNVEMQI